MKRISHITISNFKAYCQPTDIDNGKGCNLLIYGENGSGKSSLYKAIAYFVTSSIVNSRFETNQFIDADEGEIRIKFKDEETEQEQEYVVKSQPTESTVNGVRLLTDAAGMMGYVDYKLLLEFYLSGTENPELFELVILKLLGRHVMTRGTIISDSWKEIKDKLYNTPHRETKNHRRGLEMLNTFNAEIRTLLANVQTIVNSFLTQYFPHMDISINFVWDDLQFLYGTRNRKEDWRIESNLKIEVRKAGNIAIPHYTQTLNEARLSAIAMCIYLASLKQMPQMVELKLLILDDVFIGIDTGNRMPMLRLLRNEFNDYQIIMTTYDRSWYNMVADFFRNENVRTWKCFELYEGTYELPSTLKISRPIVTESLSDYAHAMKYLHEENYIDYPAAANYLRKSFEDMLEMKMPTGVITDKDKNPIEGYRLSTIVECSKVFFEQTKNLGSQFADGLAAISCVQNYLHHLIHPLSHHVPNMPVYKQELKEVATAYENLHSVCDNLHLRERVSCVLEKNDIVRFVIQGSSRWSQIYILKLCENLYSYEGQESKTTIHAIQMTRYEANGNMSYHGEINKNSHLYNVMVYDSFEDTLRKITAHLNSLPNSSDYILLQNHRDMFQKRCADESWSAIS